MRDKDRKREGGQEESKQEPSKFAKRNEGVSVMSARERYLARKMARDASKSHVVQDDD